MPDGRDAVEEAKHRAVGRIASAVWALAPVSLVALARSTSAAEAASSLVPLASSPPEAAIVDRPVGDAEAFLGSW
jgi:hypothetical protein